MEQPPVIAEHHEVRRLHAHLRHIVDLQAAALVRGRLDAGLGIRQNGIQHTGGDPEGGLIGHIVDHVEQLVHPLTGLGGDKQDGGVGHIGQISADLLRHAGHGLVVLFHQIPFVHHDDAGLARLVGHTGHLGVLLSDTFGGVDHDQAHVRPVDGHSCPEDTVFLNILFDFGLFPHTGGVDKDEAALIVGKAGVDGVAGGARHVGHDDPFLP